jgi:hypothetical protein
MIIIDEKKIDDDTIEIIPNGNLDNKSVIILKNVCQGHLKKQKKVLLNLDGIFHISLKGKMFLDEIKKQVSIINKPIYL